MASFKHFSHRNVQNYFCTVSIASNQINQFKICLTINKFGHSLVSWFDVSVHSITIFRFPFYMRLTFCSRYDSLSIIPACLFNFVVNFWFGSKTTFFAFKLQPKCQFAITLIPEFNQIPCRRSLKPAFISIPSNWFRSGIVTIFSVLVYSDSGRERGRERWLLFIV